MKQVFLAMQESPLPDDWIHLVNEDKQSLDLNLTNIEISKLSKKEFKRIVKSKVKKCTIMQLEAIKQGHSKVKHIIHSNLQAPQSYLTNPLFSNKQSSLLFNLRCKGVNEFKCNMFASTCPVCKISQDTQEHALICLNPKATER